MRGTFRGVFVVLLLALLPAAPATAFSPPPEARIWLGTWHTNQGTVIFNDISECRPAPTPQDFPYCHLNGEWHQPEATTGFGGTPVPGGWKPISGVISLGSRYKGETWEGCFPLPGTPSGTSCTFNSDGDMLIGRSGTHFIEGYWKACGLGEICPDHHPIRGEKVGAPTCPPAADPSLAHAACGSGTEAWPFRYEVLARYGEKHDGIIELPTTEADVNPRDGFGVILKLSHGAICPASSFHADVTGRDFSNGFSQNAANRRDCELRIDVPHEGDYKVSLTGTVQGRAVAQEQTIRVQDWLIVALGDSLASGEGNPDILAGGGRLTGRWEDPACHRSHYSWDAQIAQRLENRDRETSVTFVSLACSGAGIESGILGPYNGLHNTAPINPQLDEARDLAGGREVDAVLVSAGINDLGFGDLVLFCATTRNCVDSTYKDGMTVRQYAAARLARLPGLLTRLKDGLGLLAPDDRIYITVYPNELHAPDGAFCGKVADNPLGSIDAGEARFLYEDMQLRLNGEIEAAFGHGKYNLIRGVQHLFDRHGYCADGPANSDHARWVVTLPESDKRQGDNAGTLHPNEAGHAAIADLVERVLFKDLYPHGDPRRPKG